MAHICTIDEIKVELGDTFSFRIVADVAEKEPSQYGVQDFGDPNIVSVVTPVPFLQKNFGYYILEAGNIGTTTITFGWFYEPNAVGGPCPLTITVVPPKSQPGTSGEEPHSGSSNDPINLFLGEFFTPAETDINLGGPLPVTFERFYASRLRSTGFDAGTLGINWQHNYDLRLAVGDSGATVRRFGGQRVKFEKSADDWILSSPANRDYQLRETVPGIWVFWDPETQRLYQFNAIGLLTHIRDRNGNTITVEYDPAGDSVIPLQVRDDFGREINFSYIDFHFLDTLTAGPTVVDFSVNFSFLLQSVQHQALYEGPAVNTTQYRYKSSFGPGADRLTEITLPRGNRQVKLLWDTQGRVTSETNGVDKTWLYDYNLLGNNDLVTTVSDPLGKDTVYTHDSDGRLIQIQHDGRADKDLQYDATGNQKEVEAPGGQTYTAQFTPAGRPTTQTNENGDVLQTQYVTQTQDGFTYELISRQDFPDGTFMTLGYDNFGNLQQLRQRDGSLVTYAHNTRGQITRADLPDGNIEIYEYDSKARLHKLSDSSGQSSTYTYLYDDRDLVSSVTHVSDSTQVRQFTEYHPNGKLKRYVNEGGIETVIAFDQNGEISGVNSGTFAQSLIVDNSGRVTQSNEPGGRIVSTVYDEIGRKSSVGVTSNVPAALTSYSYDPASGYLSELSDPEGRTWQFGYTAGGVLNRITDPDANSVQLSFDGLGRVSRSTSAEGRTREYEYDFTGQPTEATDALGRTRAFEYDLHGGVSKITEGGVSVEARRNALGEFEEIILPSGLKWIYGYDSNGYLESIDSPYHAPAQITTTLGQVSGITFPGGLGSATLTRDSAGKIVGRSYTDGTAITYAYDTEGRLTSATPGISLGYDAAFRINESNGVMTQRSVHTGALESINFGGGVAAIYETDLTNRVTSITDSTSEGTVTLSYDVVGRLTGIIRPNGTTSTFAYDKDGLLTSYDHTPDLAGGQLSYDGASQLVAGIYHAPVEFDPASAIEEFPTAFFGKPSVQVDALGRVTGSDGDTIAWNLASQVTSITPDGGSALTLTHNAYGLITSINDGTTNREFVWNYAFGTPVISLEKIDGTNRFAYVHLPSGQLVYRIDIANNTRHYYHFNESGHTLFLTTGASALIGASAFSPYGLRQSAGTAADNHFTFSGNNGVVMLSERFYQMGVRVYDAHTARFLSTDPSFPVLGVVTANPYAYAAANPIQLSDRTGLKPAATNSTSAVDVGASVAGTVGATLETLDAAANHFRPFVENAVVKAKNLIDPQKADTTADAVRALRRLDQIEDVQDVTSGLRPSKAGKTVKALKGAGLIIQLYGLYQDGKKASDEGYEELTEHAKLLLVSLQQYDIEIARYKFMRDNKKISQRSYEYFIQRAYKIFEQRNEDLSDQHGIGLSLALSKFAANALGGFVPGYDAVKQ